MFRFLLAAALLCIVYSQDTTTHHHGHSHAPKPSSEPNEHENFRFFYESSSHQIVVVNAHHCYIFTLSDSEISVVHSDIGMRTLELKLLGLLGTATQTEVQKTDLSHRLAHACGGATNIYTMTV